MKNKLNNMSKFYTTVGKLWYYLFCLLLYPQRRVTFTWDKDQIPRTNYLKIGNYFFDSRLFTIYEAFKEEKKMITAQDCILKINNKVIKFAKNVKYL